MRLKKVGMALGKCLLGIGVFGLIHTFCDRRTDGFYLQKLFAQDIPTNPLWDTPLPSKDVEALLDQPYTFLGMGSECFTFLSQDKTTVIKFFKLDQMRFVYFKRAWKKEDHSNLDNPAHWLHRLPLPSSLEPYIQKVVGIRMFRIQNTFNSCKIAWDRLREETGLLYVHLNPTKQLHKKLVIYDKIGVKHTIDLDSTRFVMQKRAELVTPKIRKLCKEGKETEARRCIDSLVKLILERSKKGIADRDPLVKQNFGFIEDQALEIDTGSFSIDERMKNPFLSHRELYVETRELQEWLQKNSPDLAKYLDEQVNATATLSSLHSTSSNL